MTRRQRDALRRRARDTTGPVFATELKCLSCGAEGVAVYREAPLILLCDICGKRAVVRDDEQPYPASPAALPM